jgi:Mce-associated membrane protein
VIGSPRSDTSPTRDVEDDTDPTRDDSTATGETATVTVQSDTAASRGPDTSEGDHAHASPDDGDEAPATEAAPDPGTDAPARKRRRTGFSRALAFGALPALMLILAASAGYLKFLDASVRESETASIESVQAATDSTIKILSYRPDTVERDLAAARDRLTGQFRDSYTSLTNDVVIPGSKQKQISAVATVPAAASVSADPRHAVVLVFVNQTIIVANDPPSSTASSVKVTLDKIGGIWLISDFTPV